MKEKRILFIENDRDILAYEAPLLRSMGYEVYTPKVLPFSINAIVEENTDAPSTIDPEDLRLLDAYDFYENRIDDAMAQVLNRNFTTAIFCDDPTAIESMVDRFHGMLMLRPHSRPASEGTVTERIVRAAGFYLLTQIEALGARFIFSERYKEQAKKECRFFQDHAMFMPQGLAPAKNVPAWQGSEKKALFMCPCIHMEPLQEVRYDAFIKDFKVLEANIGGIQPIDVLTNKHILSNQSVEEYPALYARYNALYYDNTDKSYFEPWLFEAVRVGIPVVFLAGGPLDTLGGKKLSGRCKNTKEARRLLERLVKGDKAFAARVRKEQAVLLDGYTKKDTVGLWRDALVELDARRLIKQIPLFGLKKKRLAVVLPEGFPGGVLDITISLVRALHKGLQNSGDNIELIFAYPDHENFKDRDYFKPIRELGIPVRKFTWEKYNLHRAMELLQLKGISFSLPDPGDHGYCVMNDGIAGFIDCDFMLFTADRVPGVPLFLQPYGVFQHDFVQRLVPGVMPPEVDLNLMEALRGAKAVYTTTPVTRERGVQYAGIKRDRINLFPLFFSVSKEELEVTDSKASPYFLWSTNISPHKGHLNALQALSAYYSSGGKFQCIMTGAHTIEFLKEKTDDKTYEYLNSVRNFLANDTTLKGHLQIMGNLPKQQYVKILANAKYFFHPGMGDNGNSTAFDAAWYGVPTLSNDYSAMRYDDRMMNLGMLFFDATDVDSIVDALFEAENNIELYRQRIPARSVLYKHTVDCEQTDNEIYETVIAYSAVLGQERGVQ